jgi:branched-chain amino acid aminotransferase
MVHGTHNATPDARNEEILIYVNGELLPRKEAKISVFDSGYLVGDGVWEAVRIYNENPAFLDLHLDRLWSNAEKIRLDLQMSREELKAEIQKVVQANEMHTDVHVRIMFTRGNKKTPSQDPRLTISGPNLVIIAEHKKASTETKEKGISLFTSSIRRGSKDDLDPHLNCHSKLHEVMALNEAIEAGADEALMLDRNGNVSTCNATNFFIVKNGEVITSTGKYCLLGITRHNVIRLCAENNIVCLQKDFTVEDVYAADEAFVTGTFGGLTPVVHLDKRMIGTGRPGPMFGQLDHCYRDLLESEFSVGE